MAWTESDMITEKERELIKLLRPSDGLVRTVWIDHDGNAHMLVKWTKAYIEEQKKNLQFTIIDGEPILNKDLEVQNGEPGTKT